MVETAAKKVAGHGKALRRSASRVKPWRPAPPIVRAPFGLHISPEDLLRVCSCRHTPRKSVAERPWLSRLGWRPPSPFAKPGLGWRIPGKYCASRFDLRLLM